ncbi:MULTISPECIES: trypsin-like peptidase domain-containing protein [unclassified Microbacterium]|uniref:S1C family serine protease n=1 Tax=unclassified Microbacterium TaxID=2609290 RepID=UPI001DC95AD8|nr:MULTISPECIES: trypsin-like peptidase domain-containing protein [unclassified Microbacterium]CAH0132450.1 Periplasmic serine endoprotease DegP [Microbacterium sp. Bi121]HWK77208.1 trypsin-like peptidase domain-containing protein [Microbacterium sp.]
MNDNNTPEENSVPEQTSQPQGGTGSGHDMPAAFTSHASQQTAPTEQFTAPVAHFTAPAANTANGSSFGIPPQGPEGIGQDQTAPVTPVATKPRDKKSFGAGKVAALIVAASLVGGAAGLGTSYLGSTLWSQPVGSTATGPDTITVNNPGSVNETTAIATEVLPSVVTIQVAGSSESGSGSGVVLSDDGYVLTNTHVVTLGGAEADPTIRVTTSDGHLYNAKVVGTDPIYDLAVIKLEGASDLAPIEFGDSSKLNVGSTAVAIGAPLGLSNSVTTGIVSALNRSIQIASSAVPDSTQDSQDDQGDQGDQGGSPFQFDLPGTQQQNPNSSISISVIQTDAAINPGNSGGALVDSEGKLIGINVAIATAGSSEESGSIGVGFSIPSNIAKRVSEEIIESGAATHGLLGATVQDATSVSSADVAGAVIVDPTPGGPAADAGLKKGDIVTKFNGLPISGATDLTAQVRAAAAGSDATVTYVREGKTFEVDVTLGELDL